jgi:hypothetical protein
MIAACAAALMFNAAAALAHDDYRIIGVVANVANNRVEVKQRKDGKVISILMNEKTTVTRDKKPVDRAELKAGLNVVVDARGDDPDDLEAVSVRLVLAPVVK